MSRKPKSESREPAQIIENIFKTCAAQRQNIVNSMASAKLGSRAYLDHCKGLVTVELDLLKALQSVGYLPKGVASLGIERFDFRATVSNDGTVETRSFDMFDPDKDAHDN